MKAIPDADSSRRMRGQRQQKTRAEDLVASALRDAGLAYRRNVRALPGSPDFANQTRRWALFVNGCFWHHHEGCKRATIPTRNREFWLTKFEQNRARDSRKLDELEKRSFAVAVIWECEVLDPEVLNKQIAKLKQSLTYPSSAPR
ncbi:MAG: very short patch repair endonuclease [Roseiarcus sp.]